MNGFAPAISYLALLCSYYLVRQSSFAEERLKAVVHMLRYMQALVKVMVKNPVLWLVILVCQLMLAAPFIKGDDTMGYFLGAEQLDTALRERRKSIEEGAYDSAPPEFREQMKEELSLMTRASLTDDPAEYARLRAQLLASDLESFRAGNLIGPTEKSLESEYQFFTLLSQQEDSRIFETYREAPALFYFAAAYSSLPLLMWVLPSVVLAVLLNRSVSGRCLLAQAPLGCFTAMAGQILVLSVLSVGAIILIALPSFIIPMLVNGFGEASYPVVNVLGEAQTAVREWSVGEIVPRALLMLLLAAMFSTLLTHAIARVVPRRILFVAPVTVCLLLAWPMVEAYMAMGSLPGVESVNNESAMLEVIAPYNPLSYLNDFMDVAGRANYWPNQVQLNDERLTLGLAAVVLLGWAFVALAIAFGAVAVRGRALARKDAHRPASSGSGMVVQGVLLSYGTHVVIDNASCELPPGTITGLIAPNGKGKTTLLEAMVALSGTRRAGSVHANGIASAQAAFRRLVLYVPCDAGLLYPNLSAADHIKLAAALWPDKVDTRKLIELCGLTGYLNKPVRAYSSGMKQQLALAVAYCTGVRYLVLDEPMNALDPGNVALNTYIMKRLALQGMSILLSSLILSNLDELCDTMLAIKDGSLIRAALDAESGGAREVYERLFGMPRTYGSEGKDGTP